MAGEFSGSDIAGSLASLGSTLASPFAAPLAATASGAGMVANGLANGAGYLSSLIQPTPPPTMSSPYSSPSQAPSYNVPDTGGFGGSSFNMNALTSAMSPSPTIRSPANNISATPAASSDILAGLGGWMNGAGSMVSKAFTPTPPPAQSPIPSTGSAVWTDKQVSPVPSAPTMASPISATSKGGLTIDSAGQLSRPNNGYLSSISGFYSDVGDSKSTSIIGSGLNGKPAQKDTWSVPGQSKDVQIVDQKDALEYERQQAVANHRPGDARYYQNEIDKLAQNDIRLADDYHHKAEDTGTNQLSNPYENAGDAALSFLKGGSKDNYTKNYSFNSSVTGDLGVNSLLTDGKGTQESAWDNAVSKFTTGSDNNKISNYLPAIAAWRSAEGSSGPYGSLGSYDSSGNKIPVSADNISKLPQAYQDAFAKINSGQRDTPASKYTIPDYFKSSSEAIPVYKPPGDDIVSALPAEYKSPVTAGTSVASKGDIVSGLSDMNSRISGAVGIGTASALEEKDATIIGGNPLVTPAADIGTQKYVVNDNFNLKQSLLGNVDTEKIALKSTQDQLVAAGAKGSFDSTGKFNYEFNRDNPTQVALNNQMIGQQAVVDADVTRANAVPLTPVSSTTQDGTTPKQSGDFLGDLWGNTDSWVTKNVTTKLFPSYEQVGVGLLGGADNVVKGISGAEKSLGISPLYEATNAHDLLPSEKFLAYNRPEGFTKTVLDQNGNGEKVTFGGIDESTPGGAGVRFTQSAIQGAFNMPRDKPLETATWLAMPGAFKAGEGALGYIGTKVGSKVAPELAIKASPFLTAGATGVKTALMGNFVAGEAARVPGYDVNLLNPLSGKEVFAGRTIEGYDKNNQPIYASQSPSASGTRFGELGMGVTSMMAGSGIAAPYKFAYKENLPAPGEPLIQKYITKPIGTEMSVLGDAAVTKFYKLGDMAKAIGGGTKQVEVTPKPNEFDNLLSGARDMFKTSSNAVESADKKLNPIGAQAANIDGSLNPAKTYIVHMTAPENVASIQNTGLKYGNQGDIMSTAQFGKGGDVGSIIDKARLDPRYTRADAVVFEMSPEEWRARNVVTSTVTNDVVPKNQFVTTIKGNYGDPVEIKPITSNNAIDNIMGNYRDKLNPVQTVSKFGQIPVESVPVESKVNIPNYGNAPALDTSITIPSRGDFGTDNMGTTKTIDVPLSERLAQVSSIWKSAGNSDVVRAASKPYVIPMEATEAQAKIGGNSGITSLPKVETSDLIPEQTFAQKNLPSFSKWMGKGTTETPVVKASVNNGMQSINEIKYLNDVKGPAFGQAGGFPQIEEEAFINLHNRGELGTGAAKGSIATQTTEAAAMAATGKTAGLNRSVADIDYINANPDAFNTKMADEISAILKGRGYTDVSVKTTSPSGKRFDFKAFGKTRNVIPDKYSSFRNYSDRAYDISAKAPDGEKIKYEMSSGIDLKIWGMDQPLAKGEGRYNVRSLFTPAEERSSGFWNNLFLTPKEDQVGLIDSIKSGYNKGGVTNALKSGAINALSPNSLAPGKISMPNSLGDTLFGSPTVRQKYKEDYVDTTADQRYVNPLASGESEPTKLKPVTVSRMYNTFMDKLDNTRTTMRKAVSRDPTAIEENGKLGKTVWDMDNMYTKFKANYDTNVDRMTPKQKADSSRMLNSMGSTIDKIKGATVEMRMSVDGPIERIPVKNLVDKYDMKARSQLGGQAIQATPDTMNPFERIEGKILTGSKSATALTGKGMAGIQLGRQGRTPDVKSITGSKNYLLDEILYQNKLASRESAAKEKISDSKTKSSKIPASVSASSGFKLPAGLLGSSNGKRSSGIAGALSASASGGRSSGTPSKSQSSPSKPGPSGSRGSGSRSSSSSSSSYFSSSSSSSPSNSGSSSSSSGSSGSGSGFSQSAFGAPFLAPPGGGGGNGGGVGHASNVLVNPLAGLEVANHDTLKRMFNFKNPNKLALDVSSQLRQTQPYGTAGAAAEYSRGVSASTKEAGAMRRRKSSKPKIKSRIKSVKKKGTYK